MVDDGKNNGNDVKGFNYDILVEEALKNVVKKVIKLTSEKGLIGDSHFFISFSLQEAFIYKLELERHFDSPSYNSFVQSHTFSDTIYR